MSRFAPQIVEEDSYELMELRDLVEEFDHLLDLCMTRVLNAEDNKTLNELYGLLQLEEHKHWEGVSDEMVANIISWMDGDFPMVRYSLGMLPSDQD